MPLRAKTLSSQLKRRILVNVRTVVKKGVLHFLHESGEYDVAFYMHFHIVPKRQVRSFAFGKPEGIRVFLIESGKVASAIDLVYKKRSLRFSAAYEGNSLQRLLDALNDLERKYNKVKENVEPVLIYFLLAPHPVLLAKGKTITDYFQFPAGKIRRISKERLQSQIQRIIKRHK